MAKFDDLLKLVLRNEGVGLPGNPTGLAHIKGDMGGWTQWGISQRSWSDLVLKPGYSGFPLEVQGLSKDQAAQIYLQEYYNPVRPDELPPGVAYVIFDASVNQGPKTARQVLQRAIGVEDDGVWGTKTQAALRLAVRNIPRLIEECCWQRLREYTKDSKAAGEESRNSWFLTILWVPRLLKVRLEALQMEAV